MLLFVSSLLALGVLEVALRLFFPNLANTEAYVFDIETGGRLKPGYRGTDFGVDVSINSLGMRDDDLPLEKPAGTTRILVLGDSWTFGAGVSAAESWPEQLETALAARGLEVEVANGGVSGYETVQEAIRYRRDLAGFEHDLLIVGVFPVNDVHAKHLRHERYQALRDIHPLLLDLYLLPKKFAISQLYNHWRKERKKARETEYYAKLAGETRSANGFPPGESDWTQLYNDSYEGWIAMRDAFRDIAATAAEHRVPAVAVLFCDLTDLRRYVDYCHPRVAGKLRDAIESAGMTFIDLKDAFAPYAGRETEIALDGRPGATHPGPTGYRLMAESIAREWIERGLLPSSK